MQMKASVKKKKVSVSLYLFAMATVCMKEPHCMEEKNNPDSTATLTQVVTLWETWHAIEFFKLD